MKVTIDQDKCTSCGDCINKCAGNLFFASWDGSVQIAGHCIDCMACTEPDFCPQGAVEVEA